MFLRPGTILVAILARLIAPGGSSKYKEIREYMTEEDYWASDSELHEVIEAAAAQGEMLLIKAKIGPPSLGDYQIKPLYESNPWQPANTYYMVTLWAENVGWLFDNYEAAFEWVRQQLEASGDDGEQGLIRASLINRRI